MRKIRFVASVVLTAFFYISFSVYLAHFDLVNAVMFGSYPVGSKIVVLENLFIGLPNSLTFVGFFLLMVIAVLTGINILLLVTRIRYLRSEGSLRLLAGGGIFLGIVSGGCAVCGLPVLAFLGVGGSIVSLPFEGYWLSIAAVVMLVFSLVIMLRTRVVLKKCKFAT